MAITDKPDGLRGDYSRATADYTVAQDWEHYTADDHAVWAVLYKRQLELRTDAGLRVYGAGILSSKGETVYSITEPH